MPVPAVIVELIDRFERNREAYRSGQYNETQLRREFIDPSFKALGWDVDNEQGYAEAYKDVVHEDAIKIGGATKAPDYCFRIGGTRKFFLEAKKPSVNIKDEVHPAYQLRRYAWSAKLPLSILTDFEEFAVYDCRIKPDQTDKTAAARTLYLSYADYARRWDELAAIFSREAVLKGSFDKYAESNKAKKGTAEVDAAFLQEIERWRDLLARNLALRNPGLGQRDLNTAVQATIDRIIFLRIGEDRGLEPYGRLMALQNGGQVYERLGQLFRQADDRYNSGLFHFKPEKGRAEPPDEWTLNLVVDDKPLKDLLKNLYYPDSPYEFSVLPADILGQVYEQFLGKVIRLTSGHRAIVEAKPEVKKAGGVYYTPTYIVDYIVRQTVGRLVEGKTPRQVEGLKITDPACGSGSFLIGAYQYLLDWHRDAYTEQMSQRDLPKSKIQNLKSKIYQGQGGEWYLTTGERKRILLDHIYGVDIDPQAVEVTKLSLLLKVLEGESGQGLATQLSFLQERALPDLADNIKCGNSLIGPDFYDAPRAGQQMSFLALDEEERYRINVFDWQAEFPQIFTPSQPSPSEGEGKGGGFDVVIGNPPYIDSEWMTQYLPKWRNYCISRYRAASGNWDLFCVFIEKAIDLCKPGGLTSMIVPNKLGAASYAAGARYVLTVQNCLTSIRDYSHVPVFPVSVYPIVYVAQKALPKQNSAVKYERMGVSHSNTIEPMKTQDLDYSRYFAEYNRPWPIFADIHEASPIERIRTKFPGLDSIAEVLGAATVSEAYELKPLIWESPDEETSELKVINSGTIDRYNTLWGQKEFRYLGNSYLRPIIPSNLKKNLPKKRKHQSEQLKIIIAGMTKVLECTIDLEGSILAGKSTSIIFSSINLKYLLGLLNSELMNFFYHGIFGGNKMQGGYLRIGPPQLRQLPIRTIDFSNPTDKAHHDQMVALVERMLALHQQLASAKTGHDKTALQRQIAATDRQIDRLVYQLYNLTEEEIKIIEESGK